MLYKFLSVHFDQETKMQDLKRVIQKVVTHERTPLVLTVVSCTGVVATAIVAMRAAPKATQALAELRDEISHDVGYSYEEKIPFKDAVKATWKIYIPPVCVGLATISTIIANDRVNAKRTAIFSASAALAANTLREYQQHILEEIGAEKESKIRDKIAKDKVKHNPLPAEEHDIFISSGDGVLVCYDSLSGRYFKSNVELIRSIENDLNRHILSHMSISLNELYMSLGLEPIDVGSILGFNIDNMIDFHFSAQLDQSKKPVLVMSHINMPVPAYDKNL
jgi:hypothetical protein